MAHKHFPAVCLILLMAVSGAAAASHKVRVNDPALSQTLMARGGKLIADYGDFQIVETDEDPAVVAGPGRLEPADDMDVIHLNARRLNTRRAEVQALRKPAASFSGKRLHLVHFAGPIKPEWIKALDQSGALIIGYVPQNAYLVQGDAAALARLQSWARTVDFVQWEGDFAGDYKIDPRARPVAAKNATAQPGTDLFTVQLVEDADANPGTLALIDQMRLQPARREFSTLRYRNIIVHLPPDQLDRIAARPDVVSIQPRFEPKKLDECQDQIVAGNLAAGLPTGPGYLAWLASKGFSQSQFDASGFVVDVSDSGIDSGTNPPGHFGLYTLGNPAQSNRVAYSRLEGTANGGSTLEGCDGHGNLNAHTIAGYSAFSGFPYADTNGFSYGLGVCPYVKVGSSVVFDPDFWTSPVYADLQADAYHDGARISANSWGNVYSGGTYDAEAQAYDALVRDAQPASATNAAAGNQQMVIIFAAGNNGPQGYTINSPGSAKNVITVGASENVRSLSTTNGGNDPQGNDACYNPDTSADNAADMTDFSSRGPCADGRLKPDLVAPGSHVTGGVAQSGTLTNGTGVALACFNADGVTALPGGGTMCGTDYGSIGNPNNYFPLNQQFYTVSSGTSHATPAVAGACALLRQYFINQTLAPPSPAMTKAFLMNSARYLDGAEANDTLWSTNQGMGGLNLGLAFDGASHILRDQVTTNKFTATGQTNILGGIIGDSTKPFRVTLAWTDAPGTTYGNAWNNDLDLTVIVGGVAYK
jgi:Subtilase family